MSRFYFSYIALQRPQDDFGVTSKGWIPFFGTKFLLFGASVDLTGPLQEIARVISGDLQ